MSGKFVLIASYVKSGNTWTRIVFAKLQRGLDFPLNGLDGIFAGMLLRVIFDGFAPVNAADLLTNELEAYLPDVHRRIAEQIEDRIFIKVHGAAHRTWKDEWIYPPECVHSTIYLVRHPYDVAVS